MKENNNRVSDLRKQRFVDSLQLRSAIRSLWGIALVAGSIFFTDRTPVMGQTVLFLNRFTGSELSPIWVAALPNAHCGTFPSGSSLVARYAGTPRFTFQTLGSNPILRLNNNMGPLQRRGWCSSTNFITRSLHYEIRFNTLQQSPATSIDAFVEIWILDAADANRYDIASPYGGGFGTDLYFFAGSSVDNDYRHNSYSYQNNTWYRLVLEGAFGQNIRASLRDDDGTELIGNTLDHGLAVFESGFKIGLSQTIGASGVPYPADVAVDYAILMTAESPPTIIVQPQDLRVEGGTNVNFNVTAAGNGPLKYQWYFRSRELSGQTNATMSLPHVRFADRGNYAVRISNQFGSTSSSDARLLVTPWWRFWH